MGELSFGAYRLNTQKSRLYHQDQPLELEPQIYGILELLIARHGEVVSRDEIIDAVWDGRLVSNNVIDNRIKSARAAIGDDGKAQLYIKTYPNRGYKFIGKLTRVDEAPSLTEPVSPPAVIPSSSQPEPDITELEQPSKTSASFFQKSTVLKLAAMALIGVFGFFVLSQTTSSGITQAPPLSEVNDETPVYRLATSDDPDALPRLAVLPFKIIGDQPEYNYLPEIIRGEINKVITAIDGVTVVSLSSAAQLSVGIEGYKTTENLFNLDYAILSKLTPYDGGYRINISLIRIEDRAVLYTEVYDLDLSAVGDLQQMPAKIAKSVTLKTANKLDLSINTLPILWQNYDFYKKINEAVTVSAPKDYESIKKGAALLRAAIEDEPNYIGAYSYLGSFLSWQRLFALDDSQALRQEERELLETMNKIAPTATETLIRNVFMGVEGLIPIGASSDYDNRDPVSVMKYILDKDPDNLIAIASLATLTKSRWRDPSDTVKAYERVLSVAPTEVWALADYSWALFCNEEIEKASSVRYQTGKWYPGHRDVLLAEIQTAQVIGDYETALTNIKYLLDQGPVNQEEAGWLLSIFLDLGHPNLARTHIRTPFRTAYLNAVTGNKKAALEVIENRGSSRSALIIRMIADENYIPQNHSVSRYFKNVGNPNDTTAVSLCNLGALMSDTYFLKKIGSDKFEDFYSLLTEYYTNKDVEKLKTRRDYTSLIGLYLLQDNPDKALEVLDIAIERGFIFIGSLKEPHLRDLASHPGFAERLEKMQKSADLLIEKYYPVD